MTRVVDQLLLEARPVSNGGTDLRECSNSCVGCCFWAPAVSGCAGYASKRKLATPLCEILMACLVALFAPAALGQVTVFNDFGPGHDGWDYNWGLGWTIAGENLTGQYGVEQAMGFTSPSTGVVSDVWVAMWYRPLDSLPDEVTLRLARNPNGQPPRPEDVMEEWLITDFDSWSQWNPPIHLEASGTSLLEAGASYWLWASGGETTWCGWCMNSNPGYTCRHTLRREGEDWLPIANETASAFRVDAWPRELGDLKDRKSVV